MPQIIGQKIEVRSSRKKTLLYLIASALFVLGGFDFALHPGKFANSSYHPRSPQFIYAVGIITIVFSGLCVFVFVKRLFETRPRLVIDEDGIVYDPRHPIEGKVTWSEVEKISLADIGIGLNTNKFLMISLKDNDRFIANEKSDIKRKMMEYNMRYGGPIGLATDSLQIPPEELLSIAMKAKRDSDQQASA